MAKFINVKPSEYHPQSQTTVITYSSPSDSHQISTSHDAKPRKPITSIPPPVYEMATYDSNSLKSLKEQPIDLATFNRLKFVWLDPLLFETRDIYDQISGMFQWEMCESQYQCVNYICNECANKRVFFITCGSLGTKVVPLVHDLPQLYCIYVYCADVIYNQIWANKFSKIRVVCNNDDKYLLPQFAVDVAQANIDWGNALLNAEYSVKKSASASTASKTDARLHVNQVKFHNYPSTVLQHVVMPASNLQINNLSSIPLFRPLNKNINNYPCIFSTNGYSQAYPLDNSNSPSESTVSSSKPLSTDPISTSSATAQIPPLMFVKVSLFQQQSYENPTLQKATQHTPVKIDDFSASTSQPLTAQNMKQSNSCESTISTVSTQKRQRKSLVIIDPVSNKPIEIPTQSTNLSTIELSSSTNIENERYSTKPTTINSVVSHIKLTVDNSDRSIQADC
ncbi:unnamed protein product [Rotaria sp. Silwood1]|nr:unnamed protein product [Rotaria sp. Silwood1]